MTKRKSDPVFKPYEMSQMRLMRQSYDEKIPAGHLVRLVNEAIEALDLAVLEEQYAGGGTSSCQPKMMLKVLVYAYCKKIYTSRKIAEALEENIHVVWEKRRARYEGCNRRSVQPGGGAIGGEGIYQAGEGLPARLEKYEAQKEVLAGRKSYKEDRGAEKAWPKPAYNVHNQSSDPVTLIPHLKKLKHFPKNMVADAAYGSEENYAYLEERHIGYYPQTSVSS
jgi:hypothetical protein